MGTINHTDRFILANHVYGEDSGKVTVLSGYETEDSTGLPSDLEIYPFKKTGTKEVSFVVRHPGDENDWKILSETFFKKDIFTTVCVLVFLLGFVMMPGKVFGTGDNNDEFCEKLHIYGEDRPLTSYEKRQKYGMNGGYTYVKDEGIWAYTTEFRKMFGMPCDRVDNTLKGAEAVTMYFSRTTRKRCHKLKNGKEKCVRSWLLHLDLYMKPGQDLGFTSNHERNSKPIYNSLFELAKKKPELQQKWEELFDLKDVRLFLRSPEGQRKEIYIEPTGYKKESKGDLVTASFLLDEAMIAGDSDDVRIIEFRDKYGIVVHSVELAAHFVNRVVTYPANFPELSIENWSGGTESGTHVWIYTKEFAEKFDLPEENISEELEGALAISFRVAHYGWIRCGFFGAGETPESCSEATVLMFEFYLPSDADLNYVNNRRLWDNYGQSHSGIFIKTEDGYYKKSEYYINKKKSGPKKLFLVNRDKVGRRRIFTKRNLGVSGCESLDVTGYYRPRQITKYFGYYQVPDISLLNGEESYLVFSDSQKVATYTKNELYERDFYRVKIPRYYRKRVLKRIDDFYEREGSLWKKVVDRLGL